MIEPKPGPLIDHSRRSVSLPRRLMPSILAIHAGKRPRPDTTVAELRAGGLMATERLDPLVTNLVEVMTNPSLVITVELSRDTNPKLATFWGTPHRAVLGLTENRHRFQLIQVEPTLLPFHLAQTTGLGPRPKLPFTGSFSVPSSALHTAETSATKSPDIAAAALRGAGVQREWYDRFLGALALRQSMWTVESIWLGRGSMRDECRLSVLDAGSGGYWRFGANEEGLVTVSTSSFEDLMRRFAALLPRLGPTE